MRCYFVRGKSIVGVETLSPGPDDELIRQAKDHFQKLASAELCDGFEVWDGARVVHRAFERGSRCSSGL